MKWQLRKAGLRDRRALHELIVRSAMELQTPAYSRAQIQAALGPVFGVDEQMIEDATYFVVQHDSDIVGCGGWSFREALFGGRPAGDTAPRILDPATDAARVRAFFVEPGFARQGIGTCILQACEEAIRAHGFERAEISATLLGEPLYRKFGFTTTGYYEITLSNAPPLRVARMVKTYKNA